MKLTLETTLHGVVSALQKQIVPHVEASFAKDAARLTTLLVTVVANAIDDLAAVRIWENQAWRALFNDAAELVDGDLAARLIAASVSVETGYKISELDVENGRLRALLVELHAEIEQQKTDAARVLNGRIWHILREVENRRAPDMQIPA